MLIAKRFLAKRVGIVRDFDENQTISTKTKWRLKLSVIHETAMAGCLFPVRMRPVSWKAQRIKVFINWNCYVSMTTFETNERLANDDCHTVISLTVTEKKVKINN
jgi:hypothetical protein